MENFDEKYKKCPMYYTISILEGKWKWIILWEIYEAEVIRYNKLKDTLQPIAHKTLSNQLKELERDQLIHREQYNQVPPKVEYFLLLTLNYLQLLLDWVRAGLDSSKCAYLQIIIPF